MDAEVSRKKGRSVLSRPKGCVMQKVRSEVMNDGKKGTLGDFLRREREARKVEKEVMFWKTKIPFPILTALENDDWDAFPNKKEIPAYLKRYCRFLLLDEEEVLQRFERQPAKKKPGLGKGGTAAVPGTTPVEASGAAPAVGDSAGQEKRSGSLRRYLPSGPGVLILVILIGVLGGFVFYNHSLYEPAVSGKEGGGERVVVPPPAPSPAAAPKATVVGDRKKGHYYLPGMKQYKQITPADRVEFASEGEAIRAGYQKAPD